MKSKMQRNRCHPTRDKLPTVCEKRQNPMRPECEVIPWPAGLPLFSTVLDHDHGPRETLDSHGSIVLRDSFRYNAGDTKETKSGARTSRDIRATRLSENKK